MRVFKQDMMIGMELWGGPECTLNRVRNGYSDQFELIGHGGRLDDIEHMAETGLSAVRYPLLWERVAPGADGACDWTWADTRTERLRSLGIDVIAGLVHHGSGPRHTHLLDPGFATGLGAYAGKVAERYPWINAWTPVNEPVTTARFSALYGIWYPHHRDEGSFWLALLNQVDGTRFAMRAVRAVNPAATLIQTDDLGLTFATAPLRDQAGFDNVRRWAGWDLLCGRLTPDHALFERIAALGLSDRLRAIADDPCPPDIIGINHYVTSDRFLDHRIRRYPPHLRGGNGRKRYVDIEAVRALDPGPPGIEGALREAWERYGIPLAVTEAHNGCTREEQMRWTAEVWDTAVALRREDVDIRAVTSWALFGAQGWNTLLTGPGLYESGAFDVRGGSARPTAVAALLRQLPGDAPRHPVVAGNGWWRRPVRLLHDTVHRPVGIAAHGLASSDPKPPPLLLYGANGALGEALARACGHRDIAHVPVDASNAAFSTAATIANWLDRHRPWAVIDAGSSAGSAVLAAACAGRGIHHTRFSSDPAERPLAAGAALTIGTSAFFSPFDEHNMGMAVVRALSHGARFAAAGDGIVSPTYVPHLVEAVLDLVIDGAHGFWHLAGDEEPSWAAFARRVALACSLDARLIDDVPTGDALPRDDASKPDRARRLPSSDVAIHQFAAGVAGLTIEPCPASATGPISPKEPELMAATA